MEDDLDQQEMMCDFLEADGHTVLSAGNSDDAWNILLANQIDLVVTDLLVRAGQAYAPKGGLSLIGKMRIKGRSGPERRMEKLPILVVTGANVATASVSIRQLSEEMGANMVLQKPVRQAQLSSAISLLLRDN